ncbi:Uncharacterized protein K02A2.6 [Eumeta japonica]|uniref:RNA-directed DNA polymerase n=1 Tax=Eumeta variegata TaxID=151549 RepID=A0A4C1SZ81_EUMVA|nr:Uncharacterized protein K02A2.6 [Eumeta japonica]
MTPVTHSDRAAPKSEQQNHVCTWCVSKAILVGLEGVFAYLDDVIIATTTLEENYGKVKEVIKRFCDHGLTIRWEKCDIFLRSINYLGHIIEAQGVRPDPKKIEAVSSMPRPENVSQLRSFLGAINYYGKFIKKMRELRYPLDNMLKIGTNWNWDSKCESSFQQFKQILQSDLLLVHYDSKLPIFVAADASMVGIGAQIFHEMPDGNRKAIYHISRSLTPSKQKYSQIVKEALALVFACIKFHRMIYGRRFTLMTDHKPLLTIFGSKKGIPTHTANRLQRWALVLMGYDFQIEYVKTNEFGNVDVLSRLIATQQKNDDLIIATIQTEHDLKFIIDDTIKHFAITQKMVSAATSKDKELFEVIKFIKHGWPAVSKLPKHVKSYNNHKESLSIVNNCIMTGERLVIPKVFRHRVLIQLHKGHQGIKRMKSLARSYVYWPNIDFDISHFVKQCQNCQICSNSPTKANLSSWPIPESALDRVHIDIAGPLRGKYYVVMVDAYLEWTQVAQTSVISSTEIIKCLHEFVSRYGQPRTPAYHPQSNGQAERFVETVKKALEKSYCETNTDDKENLLTFLSQYRATPNPNAPGSKSPSEIFIGRRIKTPLDLLKSTPNSANARNTTMEQENMGQSRVTLRPEIKYMQNCTIKTKWHGFPANAKESVQ